GKERDADAGAAQASASWLSSRGAAMASTSPEKAVVYLLEAYRNDPLAHVARLWLPVVIEQGVPLRTVSAAGYGATAASGRGQVAGFGAACRARVSVDLEASAVLWRLERVPAAAHMAFSEGGGRVLVPSGTHGTVWDVQAGVLMRTLQLPERH